MAALSSPGVTRVVMTAVPVTMSGRVLLMRMALNQSKSFVLMRITIQVASISLLLAPLAMATLLLPGVMIVAAVIMTGLERAAAMMCGRVF